MLLTRTDVEKKLNKAKTKALKGANILEQVTAVLEQDHHRDNEIVSKLRRDETEVQNLFNIDILDANRVYHISQIKDICVDYRLRFLDTKYFKGDYPQEAIAEIKYLENKHEISLEGFKIIAPSKLFVLKKVDDPLLMAPMGNGYFYLIHKWGNDLSPFRKLMMWPYKSLENLVITVAILSVFATGMVPDGLFGKAHTTGNDFLVFLFMFKFIAAFVLYYAFALGKNFNTAIWNNKYDKSR